MASIVVTWWIVAFFLRSVYTPMELGKVANLTTHLNTTVLLKTRLHIVFFFLLPKVLSCSNKSDTYGNPEEICLSSLYCELTHRTLS